MIALNEKPRSTVLSEIKGEHIFFKMREGTGLDLADSSAQGIFTDDKVTLAAAGSGQWANEGWITPDGTNHYSIIPDSTDGSDVSNIADFMSTGGLHGNGGLLIMFDLWISAVPSSNEFIFAWHPDNAQTGGFGIRLNSGGYMQLHWIAKGGSQEYEAITPLSLLINGGSGQRNSIVIYIDMKNIVSGSPDSYTVNTYYNNVAYTIRQVNVSDQIPDITSFYQGFSLFSNNNNSGQFMELNSATTPSNSRVNNLFIKRCDSDILSSLPLIAAQHYDNQHDLPRELLNIL